MIIECQNCGKKYRVNSDKLKTFAKHSIKCKQCNQIVQINPDGNVSNDDQQTIAQETNELSDVVAQEVTPRDSTDKIEGVKWFNSIQLKFSIILCIVLLFILGAYAFIDTLATKKRMTEDLNQLALRTATRLSKSLIDPLWTINENQIEENVFSEMMAKEIFAVIIKDADQKTILFGAVRDNDWRITKIKAPIDGNYISENMYIIKENNQLGAVQVFVTRKFMDLESFREIRNITITSGVLIFSIFITTFFTMKKLLIQPISSLTEAAERICLGDLDVRFKHGTKDEIGSLSNALERMQLSLKIAFKRWNTQ